jgi:hypothetical protein
VIEARMLSGGARVDGLRTASARLLRWIAAILLLIAVTSVTTALVLAGVGLFAALQIVHKHGGVIEQAAAARAFGTNDWQRTPSGRGERVIPAPIAPPVLASSDPESETAWEPGSAWNPPLASLELGGIAEENSGGAAGPPRESASPETSLDAPPGSMPEIGEAVTGSIERVTGPPEATATPQLNQRAVARQKTKPHHSLKYHVTRKPVRRIARRPAYPSAAASPFQPMFSFP